MGKVVNKILTLFFLLIIIVSLYNLYKIFSEYKNNKKAYKDVSNIVMEDDKEINIKNEEYDRLKKINEDYLFWLFIPETNINYPVVKTKDNEEYLYKNFKGEENKGGSIFVDSRNLLVNSNDILEEDNLIIHGHNMKDKSMFGTLSNLLKSEYLNENKKIYIYLENQILEYEIFSAYITNGEDFPYKTKFNNNEEFNDYINIVMKKSFNKLEYFEDGKKNIITLSTCTNATGAERTIVNAKLKSIKNLE